MIKFILPRGKGKTTAIVRECAKINEDPKRLAYVLCCSRRRVDVLMAYAKDLGVDLTHPLTATELLNGNRYSGITDILIDDADQFLSTLISMQMGRVNLHAISMGMDERCVTE